MGVYWISEGKNTPFLWHDKNHDNFFNISSKPFQSANHHGERWHNGTYSSASTIKLKGLPSRQAILFRVCSMETCQRKNAWTEAVKGVCGERN